MSIIAAFLWSKHPRKSISTMIFDNDNIQMLSKPRIHYFSKSYFNFKTNSKKMIKEFFAEIKRIQKLYKETIIIEYKIVFNVEHIPHMTPSKESIYVFEMFHDYGRKVTKKSKYIKVQSQLRNKLSGKALKNFKRELRSLYLVSRRKDTNYEYHLWTIALHATQTTYIKKLRLLRNKLVNSIWS